MTTVYMVRHAEAEGNLYRRVHGWYNSLITDNGYRQIAALRGRFADIHIDAVYSSDLFRTMTTAKAVYLSHGLELHTDPGLREISLGAWEDKPWGELERCDAMNLIRFNHSSPDFRVEGGETFAQVQARLKGTVLRLAAAHPGQTIALFSHGTAIRCLQAALRGLGPGEMDGLGHSDNTAVSCLKWDGAAFQLAFEGDNSHLDPAISTLARQSWWRRDGKRAEDVNLWFRPLDLERESQTYYEARREAWITVHGEDTPFDGESFLQDARLHCGRTPWGVTCAMAGDRMAGLIQLDPERYAKDGAGYIPFCYIVPQLRAQGLGVQLIGQAVSFYRPLGRQYLRLRCASYNTPAQHFYQRYGFYKIGEEQGSRVPLDILEKYIGYDR